MAERDIAVQPNFNVPNGGAGLNKPLYLITFNKDSQDFVSIDLPLMESVWLKAKGAFVGNNSALTNEQVLQIAKSTLEDKKSIQEMYFPWHSIKSIKNLAFNADKNK